MKKLIPLLVLGLALRLLLMPLAMHPDFKAYNLAGFLIAQKGELLTFYDHIRLLPRQDPIVGIYGDNQFNYPPLAYLTHGFSNFVLGPVIPWDAFEKLLYDYDNFRGSPNSILLMYLLKLPYLVADLIGLWLILKLGNDQREKFKLALLWVFNPINLYSAYMMGQFDIFIGVLILGTIAFSRKSKNSWGAVMLGLAGGIKLFPLVMLPFLPGNKIKNTAIGLLTYLAIILPYLPSIGFRQYALLASQSDKPLFAKIMVSGSQYLPIFVLGVALLWWINFLQAKDKSQNWWWLSAPLFLFFGISHFHPQWFAWMAPFLVLSYVKIPKTRIPIVVYLLIYAVIIFSFDPSLNIGMFGINFDLLGQISKVYDKEQFVSMFRGVFAATSIVIPYLFLKTNNDH